MLDAKKKVIVSQQQIEIMEELEANQLIRISPAPSDKFLKEPKDARRKNEVIF